MSAEATQTSHPTRAIADFLIAQFDQEIPVTLRVMEAVPDANVNYQPDPKSKTALGLLRHLAIEDAWFLNSIADGAFAQPPGEEESGIGNAATAMAYYESKGKPALERVRAMSTDDLDKIIDLFGFIQLPAVQMLGVALKHSIHHRGQLSSYLRAAGGKVPGIYGPSGDTQ